MRHCRAALTVLVLILLSVLVPGTAQAGGPTSVLLVVPGAGQTASLYYSNTNYNSLAILVEAFGGSAATGKVDRSGTSHESGPEVTLTWLIHDVQVWRVDRVFVRAAGGPWISSQVDLDGSGSIWDSPAVWHTATDGRKLTSLLDRLGVSPAYSTDNAAATSGNGAVTTIPSTAPSAVEQLTQQTKHQTAGKAGLLWGCAGLALGALITVLALLRFPTTRRVVRTGAAAEQDRPDATDLTGSPSDELSWPAQRR